MRLRRAGDSAIFAGSLVIWTGGVTAELGGVHLSLVVATRRGRRGRVVLQKGSHLCIALRTHSLSLTVYPIFLLEAEGTAKARESSGSIYLGSFIRGAN